MFLLKLVFRYLWSGKKQLGLTTALSIVGMILGVASLVVAMAVVSGYQSTLRKTVIDVSGHLLVLDRGSRLQGEVLKKVKPLIDGFEAAMPFVFLEAVMAGEGQVTGVGVEGIDPDQMKNVLRLENRIQQGTLDFTVNAEGLPGAVIGKGIAESYKLKIGDTIRVAIPLTTGLDVSSFRPKLGKFVVRGVINYGHHEFDSRYILTDLQSAQELGGIGDQISGYKIRVKNDDDALVASLRIANELQNQVYVKDWREGNRNLFEAAALEKVIIFFVLLIIVVAACFNISGTLFISVVRRFRDISVLKTMGAERKFILRLFTLQGLIIGLIGSVLGVLLGLALSYGFVYLQQDWGLISGEVYKLDKIELEFNIGDFVAIFVASLLVCYLATLAPARRGAKLSPVEGLRFE